MNNDEKRRIMNILAGALRHLQEGRPGTANNFLRNALDALDQLAGMPDGDHLSKMGAVRAHIRLALRGENAEHNITAAMSFEADLGPQESDCSAA